MTEKSNMMRVDPDFKKSLRELQEAYFEETGIRLSDPKATKLIANSSQKALPLMAVLKENKKKGEKIVRFDFKI